MAYLYLNFFDNLEQGGKNRDDFYTTSLKDQYEALKRKLGGYISDTLQEFIASAFPTQVSKNYYISMPSFDRRIKQNKRGRDCIYNIVIRPERDLYLNHILSNNYDFIIIGDVSLGNVIDITVKGIELIDVKVAKFGELKVNCSTATAFINKSFIDRTGRNITVPDYSIRDLKDSVLTHDFVDSLCNDQRCFPVPNPEIAMHTFEKWQNYINFRKYYLGKQSERFEEISNIVVCNSFMITKEVYRKNEEALSSLLLDNLELFSKGDQIILSKDVNDSYSFPLIRVDIEKNRKAVISDTFGKNGKGKSKYEVVLQRYTKESMGVSSIPPRYDEEGNVIKGVKLSQYLLGERYLFAHVDIEPDCSELEKKFDKDCKTAFEKIGNKYLSIINNELNTFISSQGPVINSKYKKLFEEYKNSLENNLDKDVEDNRDREIAREYESALKAAAKPFEETFQKNEESILAQIKNLKNSELTMEEQKSKQEDLEKSLENKRNDAEKNIMKAKSQISLRSFYISRNSRLFENKQKSITIQMQAEIDRLKKEKKNQLMVQYKNFIENDKNEIRNELSKQLEIDIAEKVENETIRRYQIYFRPEDTNYKASDVKKEIEQLDAKYLIYDDRAERTKIERQEKALNSFMGGYVKNPFLPTYLFAPETLAQETREAQKDPDWCLESLNDRQKLAVKRALASESLFLLQGPPGTGKTQVIAEITAQYARQGKKVLISSETHKAIDNVFERLPKIPEIRPLRLIPSQNGKETNYSPERLVDNFYLNIRENLDKQVSRFENFENSKKTFDEQMSLLRIDYERLLRLKKDNSIVEKERNNLVEKINKLNIELEQVRGDLNSVKEEIEEYRRTIKNVESFRFSSEGAKESFIDTFKNNVLSLLQYYVCLKDVSIDRVGDLFRIDISAIKNDLSKILSDDTTAKLEERRLELRKILQILRDPDTDEAPEEGDVNYAEYVKYQIELKEIVKKINVAQKGSHFDFSSSLVFSFLPSLINDKKLLQSLPEDLTAFKIKIQSLMSSTKDKIEKAMSEYISKQSETEEVINEKQMEISEKKRRYEELGENQSIEEYNKLNSALKQNITRFFRDFDIIEEYDSNNLENAFSIITEEWKKLENDYQRTQEENKKKIPMYKEICKYLQQEDILEEDRQSYTRELYNCVNVFGITCTSRDRFTKSQLAELGKYGIESVDIRTQGIDVVIIDEVSKSSFLDLLIPILYGKTVILVGDHRQLPPMYDLRHMGREDFEGLDENIITKELNDTYTSMYEECFFKTLYEKVPDDFKVMLNKQYRCHSHIMEVFNHFYGGNQKGLTIGKKQQDDEKQHNLTIKINNATVIEPDYHIYFVDCDQKESSAYEGSTSKVNEQEAQVAIQLLKEIDKASAEAVKEGKFIINEEKKVDERPSAGIICTYGDQAGLINKKRKYQQFTGFSGKQDEKLIISTVDDFQGDERDIIIVSMVRNPLNYDKANADFIKKFERINVALSRARKMLIVVGSRKFLSEAGIIDLPDITGNHGLDKKNFHVYKEIIDTIYFRGKVLTATDIIGGDK